MSEETKNSPGGGLAAFLQMVIGAVLRALRRSNVPVAPSVAGPVGPLAGSSTVRSTPVPEAGSKPVASTGSGTDDLGASDIDRASRPAAPGPVASTVVRWLDLCQPLVKHFESCVLKAYWDPTGKVWTIGWGETGADVVDGLVWTQDQADARLDMRLKQFGVTADAAIVVSVTDAEKAAFVSILYNVGPGRAARNGVGGRDGILVLATGAPSTLLRKLNANDHQGCADQFPLWNKSGGVVLNGLIKRRAAERDLFLTGAWQ